MATMEFEVEYYLDQASSRSLKDEIAERLSNGEWDGGELDFEGVQPWTPAGFAHDLRTAFYARDASRFEMLLMRLERRR